MLTDTPNPGSPAAVAQGCKCPVLDNAHGAGRGDGTFWISGECPLHAKPRRDDFAHERERGRMEDERGMDSDYQSQSQSGRD